MGLGAFFEAIAQIAKFLNNNVFTPSRKAEELEKEKQEALRRAEELAHGKDSKALADYIDSLPR